MSPNIRIDLNLPSKLKYLNVLGASIAALLEHAQLQDAEGEIYNVQLAVHEICTNIIEHAYDGSDDMRVEIEFCYDEKKNALTVTLKDTSPKMFIGKEKPSEDEEVSERGRGIFLAEQLMDSVQYQHHATFNEWTLKKKFN
jgi:serine/threonine-protein kinase RsbW